jgi:AGCS family alanine or glycine:cation symporter
MERVAVLSTGIRTWDDNEDNRDTMEQFNNFLVLLDGLLGSSDWFPLVLVGVGIFFTFYLGFPQLRYFSHAWKVTTGKYDDDRAPGDTTHFQALSTALSGTVGTGNIGGVGLAIFIGGPAALFWMWVTAFVGMATKLVEVSLSHKYREVAGNGTMAGGPMYYMEKALNMKWLAVFFAIATIICSFGTGNLPQSNNIAVSVQATMGIPPWVTGLVLATLLGMVIIGGIHRIAKVAQAIVPTMAALYFIGALAVILMNIDNVVPSFLRVFADAFTGSAATGGFLGASFAYAFNRGVNRGLFSNEAGQGSAPIAHASAKADEHVSEGMVSLLEPFIDTIIICTLTGLVVLASGAWTTKFENTFQQADLFIVQGQYSEDVAADREALVRFLRGQGSSVVPYEGSFQVVNGAVAPDADLTIIHARSIAEDVRFTRNGQPLTGPVSVVGGKPSDGSITISGRSLLHSSALTTQAFNFGFFGDKGQYIVALSLVLFAFSTSIAWSYYGDRAVTYLVGSNWIRSYRLIYCAGFFVAAISDTTVVWNVAAVGIVVMTLPNLFAIVMLRGEVREMIRTYWQDRVRREGRD